MVPSMKLDSMRHKGYTNEKTRKYSIIYAERLLSQGLLSRPYRLRKEST